MATHAAIATVAQRAPLEVLQVPTPIPTSTEILIRNEWTASTPLDLHQSDGGLLVNHPQVLGDSVAGTIIACGSDVTQFKQGDQVFGFAWRSLKEKSYQEFVCGPEYLFGRVPEGVGLKEAVTVPNAFVTVFHSLVVDLGLSLPWPKPEGWVPKDKDRAILV